MSVLQRIYWALEEADEEWPMGSRVLLYQRKHEFKYWLVAQKERVCFLIELPVDSELQDAEVILDLQNGMWHEVFNWEDKVRALLKSYNLPEDV